MSRISQLKARLFEKPREIYMERALLYKESYEKTEGEAAIIRRAKALENILNKMEIVINDSELIVGGRSPKPRMGVVSPEMDVDWFYEELDTIATRPQDRFEITEQDKKIFREVLYPYWKGKTLKDRVNELLPEDVKDSLPGKAFKMNQTDKGQGHIIPGYERVLNIGLGGLLKEIEEKAPDAGKASTKTFYEAAKITLKATQHFILRYRDLALELSKNKKSQERKIELEKIAHICQKVSAEPPEDFYEALQLFWFINVVMQCESNASSISPGRFDQYMYPFYKKDISEGRITQEEALELLECLWIKINEIVAVRSAESARHFAGFPIGYNIVLGGVDEKGKDATNELSYLCLKATEDIRLPQPNMGIRIHSKSPHAFLKRAAEVIRLGIGMPQIFNDEVVIPAYLNRGVPLEEARDYGVVGCVEISIPGKTYGLHDIALFNLMKVLEETLDGDCETFDELIKVYKENIKNGISLMVKGANAVDKAHREIASTPFLSLFIDDCMEKGMDVTEGGARFNFSGVQGIGVANVADSLEVVQKVVFEDRKLTFDKLKEMLAADFKGYETWQQYFINHASKYGNDIDKVDDLASDVLYKSLVVRVAGYSAFFTELDESLQNDIIRRTEHGV